MFSFWACFCANVTLICDIMAATEAGHAARACLDVCYPNSVLFVLRISQRLLVRELVFFVCFLPYNVYNCP